MSVSGVHGKGENCADTRNRSQRDTACTPRIALTRNQSVADSGADTPGGEDANFGGFPTEGSPLASRRNCGPSPHWVTSANRWQQIQKTDRRD
jgi:hypothetical protein